MYRQGSICCPAKLVALQDRDPYSDSLVGVYERTERPELSIVNFAWWGENGNVIIIFLSSGFGGTILTYFRIIMHILANIFSILNIIIFARLIGLFISD